jgi:hypothetical protein
MSEVLDYKFWETKVNPVTGYKVANSNDSIYIAMQKQRDKKRAKGDDSPIENGRSLGSGRKANAKGYVFCKQTNTYKAQARVNRKKYHLGSFDNPEDATKAYREFINNIHKMDL